MAKQESYYLLLRQNCFQDSVQYQCPEAEVLVCVSANRAEDKRERKFQKPLSTWVTEWISSQVSTGKGQFSFQSWRKAMPKLLHNCTHLTSKQSNAQNSPSKASIVHDRELPDVQAGFRKGRATRDQIANIRWITEKARAFQKNIYFCFIDYTNTFDWVDHNKLWKTLKEMGTPDYLTWLEKSLCRERSNN